MYVHADYDYDVAAPYCVAEGSPTPMMRVGFDSTTEIFLIFRCVDEAQQVYERIGSESLFKTNENEGAKKFGEYFDEHAEELVLTVT